MLIPSIGADRALKAYYSACSVEEALAYLMAYHGEGQIVAGGTLLMPQIHHGEVIVSRLVDVSAIGTMRQIAQSGQYLMIGGAVTLAGLLRSDTVQRSAPLLCEAAQQIGTPQVRHLATLAGNVLSAEGSAQGTVALVTLDAEVEITNSTGAQWLPLGSLFVRYGVSRVDSTAEIVTRIRFRRLAEGQGTALACMVPALPQMRPPYVLAMLVSLSQDGTAVDWASVAMGSSQGIWIHLAEVEQYLGGLPIDDPQSSKTFAGLVVEQAVEKKALGDAPHTRYEEITSLAASAFDRALSMAQGSRGTASVQ